MSLLFGEKWKKSDMQLSSQVKESIKSSVICWLATVDKEGSPNVSPKEIFTHHEDKLIIANIASPQSEKNILANDIVCVSFIDIIEQKGFKVKGHSRVLKNENESFLVYFDLLKEMTGGKYKILSIFEVTPESIKPIIAPSYLKYPDQNVDERRRGALEAYRIKEYLGLIK
jgi:predicted pyridoxine 5'-phosphate oxidase superfamily flavin-nucleotide-binding protein